MTNEEAIKTLQHCGAENFCPHYISTTNCYGCNMRDALDMAIEALNNSIHSLNGEWIKHEIEDTCRWVECPECHKEYPNIEMNFCPNCGKRMMGGDIK